jgi:hypothetical protein
MVGKLSFWGLTGPVEEGRTVEWAVCWRSLDDERSSGSLVDLIDTGLTDRDEVGPAISHKEEEVTLFTAGKLLDSATTLSYLHSFVQSPERLTTSTNCASVDIIASPGHD